MTVQTTTSRSSRWSRKLQPRSSWRRRCRVSWRRRTWRRWPWNRSARGWEASSCSHLRATNHRLIHFLFSLLFVSGVWHVPRPRPDRQEGLHQTDSQICEYLSTHTRLYFRYSDLILWLFILQNAPGSGQILEGFVFMKMYSSRCVVFTLILLPSCSGLCWSTKRHFPKVSVLTICVLKFCRVLKWLVFKSAVVFNQLIVDVVHGAKNNKKWKNHGIQIWKHRLGWYWETCSFCFCPAEVVTQQTFISLAAVVEQKLQRFDCCLEKTSTETSGVVFGSEKLWSVFLF